MHISGIYVIYIINYNSEGWYEWSVWGVCSVTCENGTSKRSRTCHNTAPLIEGHAECVGDEYQLKGCIRRACPGKNYLII